jgi:beta-galactosidase
MSTSFTEFSDEQIDIIKKFTDKPITTNGMPIIWHQLDYEKMFSKMDFVSNDLYEKPDSMQNICFEFDWMRPLKKDKPYWLMETSATWSQSIFNLNSYVHHPGALRAKMWLTYAMGGETVAFWLWRAHWAGHEMEHGSLLYHWGEPSLAEQQVKQVSTELKTYHDMVTQTKPQPTGVAIHYTPQSMWVYNYWMVGDKLTYDTVMYDFYRSFYDTSVNRDLIFMNGDVTQYQTVFSPYLPVMTKELVKKMVEFVQSGGTWVIGPLSGCRTEESTAHIDSAYGDIEKLTGTHVKHRFIPNPAKSTIKTGNKIYKCSVWCDAYEPAAQLGHKIIAVYNDGPAKGTAAIVECPVGKGKIILLGTMPEKKFMMKFIKILCPDQFNNKITKVSPGIVIIPRVDNDNNIKGYMTINTTVKPGKFQYNKKTIIMKPFDVKIMVI